jgi:DNA-binding NarL/FixJ family response regulator
VISSFKTAKQIDPDLNVIVVTRYPDSEILDRILQISPVTVLEKPLKVEQLNQAVKILVHNGPSSSNLPAQVSPA